MKKIIPVILAAIMIVSAAAAEVASPALPVMQTVEIRNDEGKVIEDTGLIVDVIEEEEKDEITEANTAVVEAQVIELTEIFAEIAGTDDADAEEPADEGDEAEAPVTCEEAYVQVFGEEAVEELKMIISAVSATETVNDIEDLVIDEVVPLYIGGYEEDMGDIHAVVETVVEYEEEDVLVAMLGIVIKNAEIEQADETEDEADEPQINWIPLQAVVEDGKVVIMFTEDAMKEGNGKNNILVLMRVDEYEELMGEQAE